MIKDEKTYFVSFTGEQARLYLGQACWNYHTQSIEKWQFWFKPCNSVRRPVQLELFNSVMDLLELYHRAGIIQGTASANGRRRYDITSSLIGWAHTQDDPCWCYSLWHHATLSSCIWFLFILMNAHFSNSRIYLKSDLFARLLPECRIPYTFPIGVSKQIHLDHLLIKCMPVSYERHTSL